MRWKRTDLQCPQCGAKRVWEDEIGDECGYEHICTDCGSRFYRDGYEARDETLALLRCAESLGHDHIRLRRIVPPTQGQPLPIDELIADLNQSMSAMLRHSLMVDTCGPKALIDLVVTG